ncbi:MAG: hypothetical protein IJG85_04295 [Eubacteriaceae bacterium]|nr:hypothetical protein [Eubacteriaceae bacterium]
MKKFERQLKALNAHRGEERKHAIKKGVWMRAPMTMRDKSKYDRKRDKQRWKKELY